MPKILRKIALSGVTSGNGLKSQKKKIEDSDLKKKLHIATPV